MEIVATGNVMGLDPALGVVREDTVARQTDILAIVVIIICTLYETGIRIKDGTYASFQYYQVKYQIWFPRPQLPYVPKFYYNV